jgi:photosystem II stability/assembly factor-like uncharacterized protein
VGGLDWGIYTNDGGISWERDSTLEEINYLTYSDSLHLWGLSDYWTSVRSINGGDKWERIDITMPQPGIEVRGRDIKSLDNNNVFAATTNGTYKSSDGGVTWVYHSDQPLNSFHFFNAQEVWGAGASIHAEILHSLDGGQTWNDLVTVNNPWGFESYHAVDFVDSQTGWIVGNFPRYINDNIILKTIDGGQTWIEQESNANPQLRNLHFVDAEYGWVVGQGGIIRHTCNGGELWVPQTSGTNFSLESISFVNRRNGWIVGGAFTNNGAEGVILHTSDGGQTWIDQTPGIINGLSAVSFVDSLTGWAAGGGGSTIDYGMILHTSNGGQDWVVQRQHPELELYDLEFVDSQFGWAVGYDPVTEAGIIHTTDGGLTWSGQYGAGGLDIHFVDRQHGWAVWLFGHIYHTSDGGQNWLRQKSYTSMGLVNIKFLNQSEGWIVGDWGTILHTTSGGITAIPRSPNLPAVAEKFFLYPNYPNPFNSGTAIRFEILSTRSTVTLSIFDILGKRVINLFDGELPTGNHEIKWEGKNESEREVSSGIYFYYIKVDGYKQVRKMLKLD